MNPAEHDGVTPDAEPGAAEREASASRPPTFGLRRETSAILGRLRRLHTPTIELPIVGVIHAPAREDVALLAGLSIVAVVGVVEWPIALALAGVHVLVRQSHSRSIAVIGDAMEEALLA